MAKDDCIKAGQEMHRFINTIQLTNDAVSMVCVLVKPAVGIRQRSRWGKMLGNREKGAGKQGKMNYSIDMRATAPTYKGGRSTPIF